MEMELERELHTLGQTMRNHNSAGWQLDLNIKRYRPSQMNV